MIISQVIERMIHILNEKKLILADVLQLLDDELFFVENGSVAELEATMQLKIQLRKKLMVTDIEFLQDYKHLPKLSESQVQNKLSKKEYELLKAVQKSVLEIQSTESEIQRIEYKIEETMNRVGKSLQDKMRVKQGRIRAIDAYKKNKK